MKEHCRPCTSWWVKGYVWFDAMFLNLHFWTSFNCLTLKIQIDIRSFQNWLWNFRSGFWKFIFQSTVLYPSKFHCFNSEWANLRLLHNHREFRKCWLRVAKWKVVWVVWCEKLSVQGSYISLAAASGPWRDHSNWWRLGGTSLCPWAIALVRILEIFGFKPD